MKFNIKEAFGRVAAMVKQRPVEIGLVATFIIYGSLLIWDVVGTNDKALIQSNNAEMRMFLWLFTFTVSYILNDLCPKRPQRWLYWLTPLAAAAFWWCNWAAWGSYWEGNGGALSFITTLVLCPLAVLLYRWRFSNEQFTYDIIHWVKNGVLAAVLAGVAHLLVLAIYGSLHYIFALPMSDEMVLFFALVCWAGIAPLAFLTFDGQREEFAPSRFAGTVVNWVLTPALLIYTTILYAYFIKIAATWSLPKGGVAMMVFAFTMAAVAVKALLPMLEKRRGEWFFDRFSLISLPALVMFWIGIARRVGDYGLTVSRIYLIVCGVVMTFTVLMFLVPRVAKYRYSVASLALLIALLGFVPGITSTRLAERSQAGRPAEEAVDNYSKMFYLSYSREQPFDVELAGYTSLHMVMWESDLNKVYSYKEQGEELIILSPTGQEVLRLPFSVILERQLAKAEVSLELNSGTEKLLDERFNKMMLLEDEHCALIIQSMHISTEGGSMRLADITPSWILLK